MSLFITIVFALVGAAAIATIAGVAYLIFRPERVREIRIDAGQFQKLMTDVGNLAARPIETTIAVDSLLSGPLMVKLIDLEVAPMEYRFHRSLKLTPPQPTLNDKPMVSVKL